MAEREGFEPSVSFTPHTISSRAPSAARPSLRRKTKKSLTDKTGLNQLAGYEHAEKTAHLIISSQPVISL
jgi:hypothetical protein